MDITPDAPKKKLSSFKLILLLLVGLIGLTFFLDAVGMDVIGTRESEEVIERPHPGY